MREDDSNNDVISIYDSPCYKGDELFGNMTRKNRFSQMHLSLNFDK